MKKRENKNLIKILINVFLFLLHIPSLLLYIFFFLFRLYFKRLPRYLIFNVIIIKNYVFFQRLRSQRTIRINDNAI